MLTGTCRVGNEESPDLDNQGERQLIRLENESPQKGLTEKMDIFP